MSKTILITGSTHGIGEAAAKALAAQGHQVILHGRNEMRCQEVAAEIGRLSGSQPIPYFTADLSEMRQVRALSRQIKENFDRLDVLINNAGSFYMTRQVSTDGFEMTWAVNHLSYFVLTLDLLELLKASSPARIVNVSSNSHYGARLDCDPLTGFAKGPYLNWKAYGRSKLANVLFTNELTRRIENLGITANALHPGFVRTNIWMHWGLLSRLMMPVLAKTSISPEEGAKTTVFLATSPEVESVSGKYFSDCKVVESSPESCDPAAARRLWEAAEILLA